MQNVTQVASQPVYATTTWRTKYVSIRHWICYEVWCICICVYNLYRHSTVMWLHKAFLMSTLPAGNEEQCAMTEQLDHVLGYIQEGITNRLWHWSQSVCRWKFIQWRCSNCTRCAPRSVTARLLKWLCVCMCVTVNDLNCFDCKHFDKTMHG